MTQIPANINGKSRNVDVEDVGAPIGAGHSISDISEARIIDNYSLPVPPEVCRDDF